MKDGAWQSVLETWRDVCTRHPEKLAITDGAVRWTHQELGRRARAWAVQIEALPVAANVAIHLPHSAQAVAALLGVLAVGRCFVALDPSQPAAQRVAQLDFVQADAALVLDGDVSTLREAGWQGVVITPPVAAAEDLVLPAGFAPASRACIYFTSGSSGNPKAVAWSHRTLTCAAENLQAMFAFTPDDLHSLLSPPAVAASAAQIMAVLAAGGALRLFEARRGSISSLATWLQTAGITTLQTVPALFRALAREAGGRKMWPALRVIKLGGESSTADDAQLFETCVADGAELINGLGLTEAGFNVCWFRWKPGEPLEGRILPIGRPATNLELVVETAEGQPAVNGEMGEIVIRSPSLADGYWRNSALTAAVYRDLPARPGWRELRTGDAGRWRSDGLLEHRGRLDDTVKIRGHRVDPVEIESMLAGIDFVVAATVLPQRAGEETHLYAYIQTAAGSAWDPIAFRREAAARMPDYMVPSRIHRLEILPRLENGKVDRLALAALAQTPESIPGVEPRDALEQTLHGLFSRALRRKAFGINDSFFDLGGDSIGAASLFTAIARVLRIELPLLELNLHPTIAQLAGRIRSAGWNLTDHPVALLTPLPSPEAMNFFVWPGAGSDVMALSPLAHHLGSHIALYAIQYKGADGRRIYDLGIPEMAERGIELIRGVQPTGPYALCGTSFGGIIALEVARRLRASGETVSYLGLLDTYAPGYPAVRKGLGFSDHVKLLIRKIRPVGSKDEPGLAVIKRGLLEKCIRLKARRAIRKPTSRTLLLAADRRFIYLQEACWIASHDYRPEAYDGEAHFFSVEISPPPDLFAQDKSRGWSSWFTGPFHVEVTPGSHGMHIREPHVVTLASKLGITLSPALHAWACRKKPESDWDASALWDSLAPWWDEQIGDEGSALFRTVALDAMEREINIQPGQRVLDIACGNGWLSRKLARAGASVVAIDISNSLLELARARSEGLDINYHRVDATNTNELAALGQAAFDGVICNMALQDLSSIETLFAGSLQMVRPGGRFVISLVHPASPARSATPANIPTHQIALPGQPRPHIEVMRPLPELLNSATAAGWHVDQVIELPSASAPVIAIVSLNRPA